MDLVGKHGRVRTVPMPTWVKVAIDTWTNPAGVVDGYLFRSINRGGQVLGNLLSEKVVWQMLRPYAAAAGVSKPTRSTFDGQNGWRFETHHPRQTTRSSCSFSLVTCRTVSTGSLHALSAPESS